MTAAQPVGTPEPKEPKKKEPAAPDGTKPVRCNNVVTPVVNPMTGGFSYAPGNFITGGGNVSGTITAIWLLPNGWKRIHVESREGGIGYLIVTEGGHCCEVEL